MCSRKADVEILAIIAKNAKLPYVVCLATQNTILENILIAVSWRIKFITTNFVLLFSDLVHSYILKRLFAASVEEDSTNNENRNSAARAIASWASAH